MSPRERLVAAGRGETVDRKPVLIWSASPGHRCDGLVCPRVELEQAQNTHPDQAILVEVLSPFGQALQQGLDLTELLDDDPKSGSKLLDSLKLRALKTVEAALDSGAHGIFYRLEGAYPSASTPMEYGGHYLEVDREILARACAGECNIVYVEGEGEIYFDFVSDLPCHALAWDYQTNSITIEQARKMRAGPLAADNVEADIIFARSSDSAELWLQLLSGAAPIG